MWLTWRVASLALTALRSALRCFELYDPMLFCCSHAPITRSSTLILLCRCHVTISDSTYMDSSYRTSNHRFKTRNLYLCSNGRRESHIYAPNFNHPLLLIISNLKQKGYNINCHYMTRDVTFRTPPLPVHLLPVLYHCISSYENLLYQLHIHYIHELSI